MGDTVTIDELLCYVSCKLNLMTCDALVSLCINAFTDTAIVASKLCLFNACKKGPNDPAPTEGIKYQRRRGNNSMENDVRDIITLFQEMGANAPKFAAVDLNSLPSPNVDTVDVPSLLKAVELLRKEVHSLVTVVETQQQSIQELQAVVEKTPPQNVSYASKVSSTAEQVRSEGSGNGEAPHSQRPPKGNNRVQDKPPPPPKRKKFNVGQKAPNAEAPNRRLLGIKRVKYAELFVTRLSKECDTDTIQAYILANLGLNATVEKIDNSGRNVNFSSFHISCACDDPKVFYNPALWPEHVLYRRWYPPRKSRIAANVASAAQTDSHP